ncbi:MAG: hypothetical protein WCP92_06250 [bacterium]
MEEKNIEFNERQVIVEFWISFLDKKGFERGLIVKKLSNGMYLIPTGRKKKVFFFEEIEDLVANDKGFVQIPFLIGPMDFPAPDAMSPETFASFMLSFKRAFCLPSSTQERK